MAVGAVCLLILARERTINQRHFAVDAFETVLVPVLVLVRQILQSVPHRRMTYFTGGSREQSGRAPIRSVNGTCLPQTAKNFA